MSENRRVRMTKKLMKDAYLELLENNPSEKISVTNVCKAADVNRSTFYAYYEDTIALRKDIEDDVLEQIPILSDMPETITSDKQFVDMLEHFFSYIQENQHMFRILMLQSDNRTFNRRLIETVLKKYHVESLVNNSLQFANKVNNCTVGFVTGAILIILGAAMLILNI